MQRGHYCNTYVYIYIFLKNRFLIPYFYFGSIYYCFFYSLFSWRSTSNSTRIFPFEWNRIYHSCLFHSFVYSSFVYPLSVFFYHWIHPTLIFRGRGRTVLPGWRAGGASECCFVGEVPREVFVVIVRCSHWKSHSSTSGCLMEGRLAGQLTVQWCSNPRLQAGAWPVRTYLPARLWYQHSEYEGVPHSCLSYRKCPCIYSFWYLLRFPNLEFILFERLL